MVGAQFARRKPARCVSRIGVDMKCILRIGYTDILLPDHKGVEKLVEMLSKGMKCSKQYRNDCHTRVIRIEEEVDISFELLPTSTQFEVAEELEEKAAKVAKIIKPRAKIVGSQRTLLPLYEGKP